MSDIHSTGRGGAGNIGADPDSTYTDAGIVHEGSTTNPGSSGRGGAGNIATSSPLVGATHPKGQSPLPGASPAVLAQRHDDDVVPETDLREEQSNFHTGRGGAGNEHKKKYGGHSSKREELAAAKDAEPGVLDKVKHALHLDGASHK